MISIKAAVTVEESVTQWKGMRGVGNNRTVSQWIIMIRILMKVKWAQKEKWFFVMKQFCKYFY